MNGIAIRFEDFVRGTRTFDVAGTQAAGMAALTPDRRGACARGMCGRQLAVKLCGQGLAQVHSFKGGLAAGGSIAG